jgi:hypothetical protein
MTYENVCTIKLEQDELNILDKAIEVLDNLEEVCHKNYASDEIILEVEGEHKIMTASQISKIRDNLFEFWKR